MRISRFIHALVLIVAMSGCVLFSQGGEPAPAPAAQPYYVHKVKFGGETLALIAYWYTGKSKNWERILNENRGLKPGRIRIGTEIRIPYDMIRREAPLTESAVKAANRAQRQEEKIGTPSDAAVDMREASSVQLPGTPLSEEVRRESKTASGEWDMKVSRGIEGLETNPTPKPEIQVKPQADRGAPVATPEVLKSEPAAKPEALMTREELLKELLKD